MKIRDRLARFFYGRNGIDSLHYGLLCFIIVLIILQTIFSGSAIVSFAIRILETAVLVWLIYRLFSRNISARQKESEKFSAALRAVKNFFILQKNKIRDWKSYRYKKCPHCHAVLRLPKRKGTHSVICPRCSQRFDATVRF